MKCTKTPLIAVVLLSAFLFTACKDDENAPTEKSGEVSWIMDNGISISGQPIATDDIVIIEQGSVLIAVDGKSGETVWQFQGLKNGEGDPTISHRAPLINDDIVYWAMAWGNVYAIDINSGEQIWKYEASIDFMETGMNHESFMVPPVYHNGMLYVVGYSGKLIAIDTSTGQLDWENRVWCSPGSEILWNVDKIIVVNRCDWHYSVVAFDDATGNKVWDYEASNQLSFYLLSDVNFVYIKEGVNIKGLDISTGAMAYELNTGFTEGRLQLASSKYFFMAKDDKLSAFDKKSKQEVWTYSIKRNLAFRPTLKDGHLFVGDTEYLHVLDAESGALIWEKQLHKYSNNTGGIIELISHAYTPAVNDEYVYVVHKDKLFALKR